MASLRVYRSLWASSLRRENASNDVDWEVSASGNLAAASDKRKWPGQRMTFSRPRSQNQAKPDAICHVFKNSWTWPGKPAALQVLGLPAKKHICAAVAQGKRG